MTFAAITAFAGLLTGLLAGFCLVKRTQQWCPGCGAPITSEHCPHPIDSGQLAGWERTPSGTSVL